MDTTMTLKAIRSNAKEFSRHSPEELTPHAEVSETVRERGQGRGRGRTFFLLAVSLVCVTVLTLTAYAVRKVPELNQYRIVREYAQNYDRLQNHSQMAQRSRTILLWNSFFGDNRWSLPADTLGPAYFRDELQCPTYRCDVTNTPDFLPSVDMFDAVLFHTAEPFPLLRPVPTHRSAHQQYVFALMEPPGETKHVLGDEMHFYNLTMTYRLDSDIVWPYMVIEDIASKQVVAPAEHPRWREMPSEDFNETEVWRLWPGKTKTAAWFVSHCDTLSKREILTAKLQKFIDVDVYGKCGPLRCEHNSKKCDELLDQQYKFYLSFENSLCTDYVTEKLYKALRRSIVPVVYGGADYKRLVPPHSYINAEDFESVEALAEYLKYLATHPAEYMRYFWWRRYYRLTYVSPFCALCEKLNSLTYAQKSQSYRDIEQWWLGGSCRFTSKIAL